MRYLSQGTQRGFPPGSLWVCIPPRLLLLVLLVLLLVRFWFQHACLGLPALGLVWSLLPWHRLEQVSSAHPASAPSYWSVLEAVGWSYWGWLCLLSPWMGERADPRTLDIFGGFICPEDPRGSSLDSALSCCLWGLAIGGHCLARAGPALAQAKSPGAHGDPQSAGMSAGSSPRRQQHR